MNGRWVYLYRAVDKAGNAVGLLLRAERAVAAAKALFRRAFANQGRLPRKITLDGYQASYRPARELLAQHRGGVRTRIRSSKYLNSLIEQDHRTIKRRLGSMLGFKRLRHAAITIAGVELMHSIRRGQFALSKFRAAGTTALEIWTAVLAA
nr:DDE-type integrase/transposase/recombinase [Methylosinus sp. LW4]